jgi:hypothetical protein
VGDLNYWLKKICLCIVLVLKAFLNQNNDCFSFNAKNTEGPLVSANLFSYGVFFTKLNFDSIFNNKIQPMNKGGFESKINKNLSVSTKF